MRKKLLFLVSILALMLSVTAQGISFLNDGFVFVEIQGAEHQVSVSLYNNSFEGDLVIPAEVTNEGITYFVTKIYDGAFSGRAGVTSVTIPALVNEIGSNTFYNMQSLKEIVVEEGNANYCSVDGVLYNNDKTLLIKCPNAKTECMIPSSVTTIGAYSFSYCENLTSVMLPPSLKTIKEYAFTGSGLTSVDISESVTSIGNFALAICNNLTEVSIPASVTQIGTGVFNDCPALEAINVDGGNKKFSSEDGALFNYNKKLLVKCPGTKTEYVIPASVRNISYGAFLGSHHLTSITIPASVTSVGEYPFIFCSALKEINVEEGNRYYSSEDGVLYNRAKTELIRCPEAKTECVIPESVTEISYYAFGRCGLTSLDIPESVTEIGDNAFYYCNNLVSITLPQSITSLKPNTFCECHSLTSLALPESLVSIEDYAFANCKNLASLTLPESLASIGDYAFSGCTSLSAIPLPASLNSIGLWAFSGCSSLTSINIPASTGVGYNAFTNCSELEEINVEEGNQHISSENGVVFNLDKTVLALCPGGRTEYVIPESVTKINLYAFAFNDRLETVTIPASVDLLYGPCFYSCDALKDIYYYAENPGRGLYNNFSYNIYNNATLHVPESALEAYKETAPWSYFKNITAIDITGINETTADFDDALPYEIYDLRGIRVGSDIESLVSGIYIMRQGNKVRKIVVK